MKHSSLIAFIAPILSIATSPPGFSQEVGGRNEVIYQWTGTGSYDSCGYAVDNVGDFNGDGTPDILIGSPFEENGSKQSAGAVFVYSGVDGKLLRQWKGNWEYYFFGSTIAGLGDVNNDGLDDIAVGRLYVDSGSGDGGSVKVYSGNGGQLFAFYGQAESKFGTSVSRAGDVDGDGHDDILIGAPRDSGFWGNSEAIVYSGRTGAELYSWQSSNHADLGTGLSDMGDVNGDGYDDVAIGAPGLRQVFVYSGADGNVLFQVSSPNGSHFGEAVSRAGDVDGDGVEDLIVGAPRETYNGINHAGTATVYSGRTQEVLHHFHGEREIGFFGAAVSDAGDMNGDGIDDVFIGAPYGGVGEDETGVLFLYSGANGKLIRQWTGHPESEFGSSIASLGDHYSDAMNRFIVGAPSYSPGATRTGQAKVYGYTPYMAMSDDVISIVEGGRIQISMDFPHDAAGYRYKVLASGSGTGPTTRGIAIPLTFDSLTYKSNQGIYAGVTHLNIHGTLDTNGDGHAGFDAPAGINPWLLGQTYWFATVAIDPNGIPRYSSMASAIQLRLF